MADWRLSLYPMYNSHALTRKRKLTDLAKKKINKNNTKRLAMQDAGCRLKMLTNAQEYAHIVVTRHRTNRLTNKE
jgi:hypothetical protein